jgi:sulfur-oxidizing protein SoxZ|tara:strand:+ start:296 stop:622 length:327 start_codon:yes stop_codon:yes gene_type:complete
VAKKPKVRVPKTAKKGQVVRIKTLFPHRMESGQRKDPKTGEKIPRFIVKEFVCAFNGEEVFRADMYPGMAANPFFSFFTRVSESGTFEFTWTDDRDETVTVRRDIKVD